MKQAISILLICCFVSSLSAQLPVIDGFTQNDMAMCRYNKYQHHFLLTQETGKGTGRFLYDTAFSLTGFYEHPNAYKVYNPARVKTPLDYITGISAPSGDYEVFWQKDTYLIFKINFAGKTDSMVYRFKLSAGAKDEKTVALLTGYGRLRVLTHSKKNNQLYLYSYNPADTAMVINSFTLPEKSLTKAEYKTYGDAGLVNLKEGFSNMLVTSLEEESPFAIPGNNRLFYSDEKIYLLKKMNSDLGFTLVTLDEKASAVSLRHFITNTFDELYSLNFEDTKYSAATICDSLLIIASTSQKKFEYLFYNLNTGNLVKSHAVPLKDAPDMLFSSPLKTSEQQKKVSPAKIMKDMYAKHKILSVSQIDKDSTTITLCATKYEEPDMDRLQVGWVLKAMAKFLMGDFNGILVDIALRKILPELITTYSESVCYFHTRFSNKTLEISNKKSTWTMLDNLLEYRVNEILQRPGAFLTAAGNVYYLGWYNTQQKKMSLLQLY
jgi:hypothetical protein